MTLYTIGHSNHNIQQFLSLLNEVGIGTLVDVRSQPYSQYAIQYNREPLKAEIEKNGLKYIFAGDELGGRPKGDEYYDDDGRVLYGEYRHSDPFQKGIELLRGLTAKSKIAILCSEENPAICHRKLLIGRYLAEQGNEVLHIRGDGTIQTEAEVNAIIDGKDKSQMGLFDAEETLEWKSIRSVLPRKPLRSSSHG